MSISHSQCSIAARASSEDHRLFNKTVKSTEGISDTARKCARNDWLHRIANATFVLFFFLVFAAALSLSFWLGALSVKYRDVAHIVPFIVRFGLYASPVGFLSASLVPDLLTQDQLVWYHTLNPMVGILEGFRWCILGTNFTPLWPGLWAGTAVIAAVLVSGAYFFRLVEKTFADVI